MAGAARLSSLDAAFLYMETPECPMHVGSLSVFQLPDGYRGDFTEAFKAQIASRLDLAPMLRRKLKSTVLDLDHPSWVEDEQFDIDRHIFRGGLPAPGDMETLRRLVGWMHAKLLNRARPLWEFYVFEGLAGHQVALYAKLHHALIDGGAGVALSKIVYDLAPDARPVHPAADGSPADQPGSKGRTRRRDMAAEIAQTTFGLWRRPFDKDAGAQPVELPRTGRTDFGSMLIDHAVTQLETGLKITAALPSMVKAAAGTLPGLLDPGKLAQLPALIPPRTPLNATISSERAFGTTTVQLSRVKKLGKAAGGTVNDVVLALSSGIVRQWLAEKGALPDKPLSAAVPISLREAGNADTNNQAFAMTCRIATDVADPAERLQAIIRAASEAKALISPLKDFVPHVQNASALGLPMVMQVMVLLYGRSGLPNVLPMGANLIVSNVPGPPVPLYAAGAQMLHLWPVSIPIHGMGLNITVQSYRDQLEFGLIAGANVLPDIQRLADRVEGELLALEAAVAAAGATA
jgi:diacylglycerol O-acyltransferase / wax synthase